MNIEAKVEDFGVLFRNQLSDTKKKSEWHAKGGPSTATTYRLAKSPGKMNVGHVILFAEWGGMYPFIFKDNGSTLAGYEKPIAYMVDSWNSQIKNRSGKRHSVINGVAESANLSPSTIYRYLGESEDQDHMFPKLEKFLKISDALGLETSLLVPIAISYDI